MSTTTTPAAQSRTSKQELIASTIDKGVTGHLAITRHSGGVEFQSMNQVMEFAKLMAISKQAVPVHCRDQVGVCLGVIIQAIEWRMSPYAVASKSYVVNDRISYESQLIHAVIEQRAPIQHRLRHSFRGEGPTRRCKVWATPKGETEPLEYESPEFQTITPKNSPLWKTKPDLQLFYNASRDWARAYFPDVIMGVYADDELDAIPEHPIPRGGIAGLKERLIGATVPDDNQVADEVQPEPGDADANQEPPDNEWVAVDDESDPSGLTAEERRDLEREAKGGKLFDTHQNVGQ